MLQRFHDRYSGQGADYMMKTPKEIYLEDVWAWISQYRGWIEGPLLAEPKFDGWQGLDDPELTGLFEQPLGAAYSATVESMSQDLGVSLF